MDCVMIDRLWFERLKSEREESIARNEALKRENESLKSCNQLLTKLVDSLENIRFNLKKTVELMRAQYHIGESFEPFDMDCIVWHEEYANIKCMLAKHDAPDADADDDARHCLERSLHNRMLANEHNDNSEPFHRSAHETAIETWNHCDHSDALQVNNGNNSGEVFDILTSDLVHINSNNDNSNNNNADAKPKVRRNRKTLSSERVLVAIDGEKRFKCTWSGCAYATDNRGNFQKHYRIHTGEKPYKCAHQGCSYSCSDPARFREHKLIHSSEKSYVCEWPGCTWKFKTHKLLKNHIKACHTGDKPHRCEWPGCDKQFLNKYEVRDHMRQHTGERPFRCEYPGCNGAFARSNTLTQHIREVHYYKKQYFCDYANCDERFDCVNDLKKHVKEKHPKVVIHSLTNASVAKINIDLKASKCANK